MIQSYSENLNLWNLIYRKEDLIRARQVVNGERDDGGGGGGWREW